MKQAYDRNGNHIGIFDGEYFYDLGGTMLLRVDDDEVYTVDVLCKYAGTFEENKACSPEGRLLFRIEN